jgi:hypothetical protein
MKYGVKEARKIMCPKHQEWHYSVELCRWCEPATPVASDSNQDCQWGDAIRLWVPTFGEEDIE